MLSAWLSGNFNFHPVHACGHKTGPQQAGGDTCQNKSQSKQHRSLPGPGAPAGLCP